jgi:hypothetical protein
MTILKPDQVRLSDPAPVVSRETVTDPYIARLDAEIKAEMVSMALATGSLAAFSKAGSRRYIDGLEKARQLYTEGEAKP